MKPFRYVDLLCCTANDADLLAGVKTLKDTIKHLEDQVNNRRSLWVMKHSDPAAVARAIESLAGSEKTQEVTSKAIASLRYGDSFDEVSTPQKSSESGGAGLGVWDDVTGSPRSPFRVHPPGRGESSKYGSLAVGFQRQPSASSNERRLQSPWG